MSEPGLETKPNGKSGKRFPWLTSRLLIKLIGLYSVSALGLISFFVLASDAPPSEKATIKMGLGLNLIWVVFLGSLMVRFKDPIRRMIRKIRLPWGLVFFLFCTGLALLEEAVTVSLTNLAPLFGVEVGQALITASANYLHTALFHSVIVFLPMFLIWAVLLRFFDFPATHVFLLFGLTGSLAEISMSPTNLLAGFWVFVYGLMVYLPAYSLPRDRGARRPPWWAYPLAALLPLLSPILLLPLAPLLNFLWDRMDPVFFVESSWG